MAEESARTVFTHCHICEQLCGIAVSVRGNEILSIHPDKQNPYTWRDFCVKAQRADEVRSSPWRLQTPMRREGDRWIEATYDEAIADIAARLRKIIDRHGKDAVGGYLGNPMGFNFGATLFHYAFLEAIGTHQRYIVQSIDGNSKYVACDRVFGMPMLALLADVDAADCALLIGTNPAVSKFNWGGKVPDGWRRLKRRVRDGAALIVVDPRRTETAEHATQYLAPLPETDWALLLAMIKLIFADGTDRLPLDIAFAGLGELRAIAEATPLSQLAAICDVAEAEIAAATATFAKAERAFAFAATGPALGRHGTLTHWLTIVLNLVTDRFCREGGRFTPNWPFNMATSKAGQADPTPPSRVRGLAPVVGLHGLAELADEILVPGDGQIRALFLAGGNPVSTGAGGDHLAEALGDLDLLVCLDLFQRESHRQAHWLIPGEHFLERGELYFSLHAYNDVPFMQSARQAVTVPEGVRPEWTFYRDLAAALGHDLNVMGTPDDIAARALAASGRITLEEVRSHDHGLIYGERSLEHLWDHFRATGRTVDLCPKDFAESLLAAIAGDDLIGQPAAGHYRLISRRRNGLMNASLTETSGNLPNDETADHVEINQLDGQAQGIEPGEWLTVRSQTGSIRAKALLSADVRRGTAVMAHGWGSPLLEPGTAEVVFLRGNARNKLVSDDDLDSFSAVPRLNGTLVQLLRDAGTA